MGRLGCIRMALRTHYCDHDWRQVSIALALGIVCQNDRDDQRRTMGPALPLDAIRHLIQRLVSWPSPKRVGLGRREAGLRH
jgi:hypothetical protein